MIFASLLQSPSSRRAWIEISSRHSAEGRAAVALLAEGVDRNVCTDITSNPFQVALLAEGVDRNTLVTPRACCPLRSPSSRRAWIEIEACDEFVHIVVVALLAEGVDRNIVVSSE